MHAITTNNNISHSHYIVFIWDCLLCLMNDIVTIQNWQVVDFQAFSASAACNYYRFWENFNISCISPVNSDLTTFPVFIRQKLFTFGKMYFTVYLSMASCQYKPALPETWPSNSATHHQCHCQQRPQSWNCQYSTLTVLVGLLGSVVVRTLDLWSRNRGFDS